MLLKENDFKLNNNRIWKILLFDRFWGFVILEYISIFSVDENGFLWLGVRLNFIFRFENLRGYI